MARSTDVGLHDNSEGWIWYSNNNELSLYWSASERASTRDYGFFVNNVLIAGGDSRAPIFYDYNDTGYYMDPNSTSNSALRVRGGTLYGPNPTWGAYLAVGTNGHWSSSYGSVAVTNGNLHLDSAGGSGLYLQWYVGGTVYVENSIQAQIYYDRNDTGYYVDPASGFNLWRGTINKTAHSAGANDYHLELYSGNTGNSSNEISIRFHQGSQYWGQLRYRGGGFRFTDGSSDSLTTVSTGTLNSGDIYAPIMYDSNNSGFFVNPNGRSRLAEIDYGDGSYYFRGGSWGFRHQTPSGYIEFGPANGSHAHIYTDRSNFYYNVDDSYLNGRRIIMENRWVGNTYYGTGGDVYATIWYDANNSGYYSDPASTSRLNAISANNIYINPGHMLYGDAGGWTGEYNKIQWHSSHMYFQNLNGGYWIWRRSDGGETNYMATDGNFWMRGLGWIYDYINQNVRTNAGPTFQEVYTNGWFRNNNNNQGLYNQANGNHWSSDATYWKAGNNNSGAGGIQLRYQHEGALKGYVYWDGSGFGLLNSTGNWQLRMDPGNGNMEFYRVTYLNDSRAYIWYDRDNTGYYSDPNGTSNFARFTQRTHAAMNRGYHWITPRFDYTGDADYWTGTFGWGTSAGNWANAWKAGFAGWDIWGGGTDHPQGSGYIHAQGIVSGQHYATSDGGQAYGWMMVGAHAATENRYWLRGKWGGGTSSWTEMITTNNINSQDVNSSQFLRQFNVVYGDNWNDVYTANVFRFGQGHNISGANGPQSIGAYTYGSYMSFRFLGSSMFQFWMPENSFNGERTGAIHYRSGWNGSWSNWYRLLWLRPSHNDGNGNFMGDASYTSGGATTGHRVDSGTFYNGATSAYLELHPQSDNWATTAYRFRAYSADAAGSWLYFERYTVNGGQSVMGFVDRNTQNLYWYGSITANYSDIRLKKNISIIKNPIQKLWGLHGVEFEWVPNKEANNERDYKDVGLIAQDVQSVLPEAVRPFPNGYLSVNYDAVVALLVETVKQQQLLIDNLTQRIENLENN
jgi:hypothetical protein